MGHDATGLTSIGRLGQMGIGRRRFAPLFERTGDGSFEVNLTEAQRDLIGGLIAQMRSMIDSRNPAVSRLFPEPYGDDEERNAGYAVLAGAELVENRFAAIATIEATIESEVLDDGELNSWMRCINDLRLVIGTILDVTEDPDQEFDDQAAELHAVYEHLGFILEGIVSALME